MFIYKANTYIAALFKSVKVLLNKLYPNLLLSLFNPKGF
jgi:hypothetical protein